METVKRYLYVLHVAANPEAGRKAYLSKLGKLIADVQSQSAVKARGELNTLMDLFGNKVPRRVIEEYLSVREGPKGQEYLADLFFNIMMFGVKAKDILNNKKLRAWFTRELKTSGVTKEQIANTIVDKFGERAIEYSEWFQRLGIPVKEPEES